MSLQPFSTEPVTLAEEVFPGDTNAYGTLFGGRLMALMDKAAGFSASKFAHREFVTVSVDSRLAMAALSGNPRPPRRHPDCLESARRPGRYSRR